MCRGIGLVRIWKINSPYHTNINKSITSSTVDTLIPLAGKVALATRFTICAIVRPSRHITLTLILDSNQLLSTPKRSWTDHNIQLLESAWDSPCPPSTPIGLVRLENLLHTGALNIPNRLIVSSSYWTDLIKTFLSMGFLIGLFELIFSLKWW